VSASDSIFANPRPVQALGDLFGNIWQIAYVTPDLEGGMESLRRDFGVENITEVPVAGATFLAGDQPAPWDVRIAMGARAGLIVELIEPVAGEVGYYTRFLPEHGGLGFHHFATQIPLGDIAWKQLEGALAAAGLKVDYTVLIPDRVRAGYVDTTARLGHFMEVCQLQEADVEFFSGLRSAATASSS
jgi:hypothetical protein